MNNLEEIQFYFPWPFQVELSDQTRNYIESLQIAEPIEVFYEVPKAEGVYSEDVGWAFITDRLVYIRPTDDIKAFELRLAHELTHISLTDQGFKPIDCALDDELDYAFANLLV